MRGLLQHNKARKSRLMSGMYNACGTWRRLFSQTLAEAAEKGENYNKKKGLNKNNEAAVM